MAEMTKYEPGTPSWVDLGTPDPAEASRFYSDLFDWTIEEGPPEFGGYRMCLLDGKPVAGLGPQTNTDMPPYWTTYVTRRRRRRDRCGHHRGRRHDHRRSARCDGCRPHGRRLRPSRRGVLDLATRHPPRRGDRQRAQHVVLERVDHP